MAFRTWPDWIKIIVGTALWAAVGALALDQFDGWAMANSICVGWIVSYGFLMASLERGRSDGAALLAALARGLGVFGVTTYAFAVMIGVGSGPN
ncbi:MAG TPA: hypothetical protein VGC51_01410 [Hansschlegelia sp.]